jgi:hypothetical protein
MAGRGEKPFTLVEPDGFGINAGFHRQFANEHEAAWMGVFTALVIFLKFDRDYRPCWSIHFVTKPPAFIFNFLNALKPYFGEPSLTSTGSVECHFQEGNVEDPMHCATRTRGALANPITQLSPN